MVDPDIPFLFHPGDATPGGLVRLDDSEATHGARSLRLKTGEPLILADGRGRLSEARVTAARAGRLEVAVLSTRLLPRRAGPELWLAAAVVRGPRFDLLIEKGTELGADVFVPLITRHAGVRPSGVEKPERWRRLAIAALKQSRRAWLPRLEPVTGLDALLDAEPAGEVWVAEPGRAGPAPPAPRGGRLLLLVGPEGGWHPGEIARLKERGALFISLGDNRLRTETAALALLVYARSVLGHLGPAGTFPATGTP